MKSRDLWALAAIALAVWWLSPATSTGVTASSGGVPVESAVTKIEALAAARGMTVSQFWTWVDETAALEGTTRAAVLVRLGI